MKSTYFISSFGLCIFLLLTEVAFAQKKNPTVYPVVFQFLGFAFYSL